MELLSKYRNQIFLCCFLMFSICGYTMYKMEIYTDSRIFTYAKDPSLWYKEIPPTTTTTTATTTTTKPVTTPSKTTTTSTTLTLKLSSLAQTTISTSTVSTAQDITTQQKNNETVSKYFHLKPNEIIQLNQALENATERMLVVIWEAMFGVRDVISINESECGACDFTYDKSKSTDPTAKAIVFHFNELRLNNMPPNRRPDQFYVWWTREGTRALRVLRGMSLREYDGLFNLTMTYRQDSSVYDPYDTVPNIYKNIQAKGSGNMKKDLDELIKGKNQTALWIVSNCGSTRGAKERLKLVTQLIWAGLNIDCRGGCFPRNKPAPRSEQNEIVSKFKFYIAYENNYHCKDYITEKFLLSGLTFGAVPIVWGGRRADYELIAPPNSFIFAEDFKSPNDLVNYLKYLDKNETAYREYFEWRLMKIEHLPNYLRAMRWCALCKTIHGINNDQVFNPDYDPAKSDVPLYGYAKSRTVPSIADWFYGLEAPECAN